MNPFTESTVARPLSDLCTDPPNPVSNPPASHPLIDTSAATRLAPAQVDQPSIGNSSVNQTSINWPSRTASIAKPNLNTANQSNRPRLPLIRCVYSAAWALGLAACIMLAVPGMAYAVDVNAATQAQLEAVRGIGPKTAQIIIQERMRGGKYESFDDLSDRVKGIGPKKAASLQAAGLTLVKGVTASTSTGPSLKQSPTSTARAAK